MTNPKSTPIIHLVGPEGGGKTTLCRLFLDAFTDKSVLAIDAAPDGFLTLSYGIQSPVGLGTLLSQMETVPLNRESVDWALQDIPISVPTESDTEILPLGNLPKTLSPSQQDLLAYGLPRLFRTYDVVIWDGPFGVLAPMLDRADIRPLLVITPKDEQYCQESGFERAMILLSKAETSDELPPTAVQQIQRGNWKLLGKLPPLSPPEKRVKELPQYFQDCYNKLDLPFELRSASG